MKKESTFQSTVAPIIVLSIICLVVTFAVAFVYGITKPIIENNTIKAANEARAELLPEAKGDFKEYKGDLKVLKKDQVFVTEAYEATNGTGVVITVKSKSYGGLLTVMVGIDKDGAITKVKVTEHSDTPGVGTKPDEGPDFLPQYKGLKELKNENVKNDDSVKHITGASVSSSAIHEAVWNAMQQYKMMGGAK